MNFANVIRMYWVFWWACITIWKDVLSILVSLYNWKAVLSILVGLYKWKDVLSILVGLCNWKDVLSILVGPYNCSRHDGHKTWTSILKKIKLFLQPNLFSTTALHEGEWSASRHGRFKPVQKAPDTYLVGNLFCLRTGLDFLEKRQTHITAGKQIAICLSSDLNRDTTLTELHLRPDASLGGTVGQILICQL